MNFRLHGTFDEALKNYRTKSPKDMIEGFQEFKSKTHEEQMEMLFYSIAHTARGVMTLSDTMDAILAAIGGDDDSGETPH